MKKWVKIFFVLVIISLFSGCRQGFSQKSTSSNLVSSITITCESCGNFSRRDYSSPEKMRLILLCIRKLGPDFPARTDVDAIAGKTLCITLSCADGSRITYRIKNNQYIQKNAGQWRQINLDNASGFFQLIMNTPSDEISRISQDPLPEGQGRRAYFPGIGTLSGT